MNKLYRKLHGTYSPQRYDHTDVWAGHLCVSIDGHEFSSVLARCEADSGHSAVVTAELYVRGVDWERSADALIARLWCDANDLGDIDERGHYNWGGGRYFTMSVKRSADGVPVLSGNNLVFESEPIPLHTPGVFHYTVSLTADVRAPESARRWVPLNDIAYNRDGQIVVTSPRLREFRSINEVCLRKVGARATHDQFKSGRIAALTERLDGIEEDVIYLLPFFTPGHVDSFTGEDVRKGELGSVYAPKDFFEIDPDLVTPPEEADLPALVDAGLITDVDISDLLDERQRKRVRTAAELTAFGTWKELEDWVGRSALTQLVGRAEMRVLVGEAHRLGKRVIFDLILMQTSRDHPLIREHPDWYVLDKDGQPAIHQIAWLVYSDVALLNLMFNKPLQNYLSSIAPFWIERCDFDGVRIDASQTIDRPFLKEIKNRIHRVKEDAIVLGETLCALEESRDIPADMVYALFVDFHRDLESANSLIDFVGETNASFAPGTVAMAYFENHDSVRATRVWRERYETALEIDEGFAAYWETMTGSSKAAAWMAQLKNLQASLINATIGNGRGTRTVYGVEWGTTWGSEDQTDFENPTLVEEDKRGLPPGVYLQQGYAALRRLVHDLPALESGELTFHRPDEIGDDADRLLVYSRSTADQEVLMVHNLDPQWTRRGRINVLCESPPELLFDTFSFSIGNGSGEIVCDETALEVDVRPLQSLVYRIR